jgi:hypothetical protein
MATSTEGKNNPVITNAMAMKIWRTEDTRGQVVIGRPAGRLSKLLVDCNFITAYPTKHKIQVSVEYKYP